MAFATGKPTRPRRSAWRIDGWLIGSLVIAALILTPLIAVAWMALFPTENIWPHLLATVLPDYIINSLALMAITAIGAACIGTGGAWLTTTKDFPGRRVFHWALLAPLVIPAYIGAYALVDFLEYAGPVQSGLRGVTGWTSARDYWFPEIRSLPAAVLVLSAALYPYVYLLARAAFREQAGAGEEVAMSLGAGAFARFRRVGLPLARPAIAAGVAVVMMETVNDFGTVAYFAVQTLTTGIFSTWLESNNAGGTAQIACVILTLVVALVLIEKASRRRSRFYNTARGHRPVQRIAMTGRAGWLATVMCFVPVALGFLLPTGVILSHAVDSLSAWVDPALGRALIHTITVGGIAAIVTVLAAVFLVYGVRLSGRVLPRMLLPLTTIGYAAPGAVLGVGILIPLARADNALADWVEAMSGHDIGLILTGSAFALVLAYCVRFFAIAQGAADAAFGRVSPSLPMAARSLGRTRGQVLRSIHFPLIRSSLASALLLVFVDCVKELPATLLLRPFNYDTLATRVHDQASLENLGEAAPAAILVILVGLAAVGLLARANR